MMATYTARDAAVLGSTLACISSSYFVRSHSRKLRLSIPGFPYRIVPLVFKMTVVYGYFGFMLQLL